MTVRVLRDETERGDNKGNRGENKVSAWVRCRGGRKELLFLPPSQSEIELADAENGGLRPALPLLTVQLYQPSLPLTLSPLAPLYLHRSP